MGLLKAISHDIEELVKSGKSDDYISKSVGLDLNLIKYIIDYFRNTQDKSDSKLINT